MDRQETEVKKSEGNMSLIDMKDYTPAAKRYWWTVVFLGVWALIYSIAKIGQLEGVLLLQVLFGAAVAAIVGLFPVRIPGAKTSIARAAGDGARPTLRGWKAARAFGDLWTTSREHIATLTLNASLLEEAGRKKPGGVRRAHSLHRR